MPFVIETIHASQLTTQVAHGHRRAAAIAPLPDFLGTRCHVDPDAPFHQRIRPASAFESLQRPQKCVERLKRRRRHFAAGASNRVDQPRRDLRRPLEELVQQRRNVTG